MEELKQPEARRSIMYGEVKQSEQELMMGGGDEFLQTGPDSKHRFLSIISCITSVILFILYVYDRQASEGIPVDDNSGPTIPVDGNFGHRLDVLEAKLTSVGKSGDEMFEMLKSMKQNSGVSLRAKLRSDEMYSMLKSMEQNTTTSANGGGGESMSITDIVEFDAALERWADKHSFNDENKHPWDQKEDWSQAYNKFNHWETFEAFPMVDTAECQDLKYFAFDDEQKYYCNDRFQSKTQDCVIFSIGCNGMWEFEISVHEQTDCIVHTFDCTGSWDPPDNISDRIFFHKICLGNPSNGENFMSYQDIVDEFSPGNAPKYLKMDIEGFEFQVIRGMLKNPDAFSFLPEQIALELHSVSQMTELSWHFRQKTKIEIHSFMTMIQLCGGYRLINRLDNPFCTHCSEVLLQRPTNVQLPKITYKQFAEIFFGIDT